MHIFTLLRGLRQIQEKFMNDLDGQWLPYEIDGKKAYVEIACRPLQLVEIIFPQEHRDMVIRSIWPDGTSCPKKYWPVMAMLRKALGAKKFPDIEIHKGKKLLIGGMDNLARYPIGLREDKMVEGPTDKSTTHEGL